MALTPEGRRLTEEHRQAQQDVRDGFLAEFILLWALLDSARLDETGPGWIRAVMQLIRTYREESARVAASYYWEFREAELPALGVDPATPPSVPRDRLQIVGGGRDRRDRPSPRRRQRASSLEIPEPRNSRVRFDMPRELERDEPRPRVRFDIDESALRRGREQRRSRVTFEVPEIDWRREDRAAEISLVVTGPVSQKQKTQRGQRLDQARDNSFVESSGAATKAVLTGGRRSLLTLLEEDRQIVGWVRVTDANPCAFCAMLASRGIVRYRSEAAARFQAHDHCACTAEPVYDYDSPLPGRAQEFKDLWNEHIRGKYSGAEARREWRRLHERLQREARRAQIA